VTHEVEIRWSPVDGENIDNDRWDDPHKPSLPWRNLPVVPIRWPDTLADSALMCSSTSMPAVRSGGSRVRVRSYGDDRSWLRFAVWPD